MTSPDLEIISSILASSPPDIFSTSVISTVLSTCKSFLEDAKALQDELVTSITPENATFANTVQPLAIQENSILSRSQLIEFYSTVLTDERLRDEALEMKKLLDEFSTETTLRDDLYQLVRAVDENDAETKPLSHESRRLLIKLRQDFELKGLALDHDGRARLRQIKKDLEETTQAYTKTHAKNSGFVLLSEEELEGVEATDLKDLEKDSDTGKLKVAFKGSQYCNFITSISRSETRRKVYSAYADCHKDTVPILEKAIVLRYEKAKLLGHANHASLIASRMVVKDASKTQAFLNELLTHLKPIAETRMLQIRQKKKEDLASRNEPDDGKYYVWDRAYYAEKLVKEERPTSDFPTKEYFALEETINRMLRVFEQVLGMLFIEVPASKTKADSLTWHDDVHMFAVFDDREANTQRDRDHFLGYLYMDMYPREGKYLGYADFPVRPGFVEDGIRTHTSTALICNFAKPTPSKPCLLKHSQVVLLFHELGHGIHDLVAKTEYARFHGASTSSDFNETPSQLLEEWCWTPSTLQSLSMHYSQLSPVYMDTWKAENEGKDNKHGIDPSVDAVLPKHIIDYLIESKIKSLQGLRLTLLDMSLFDMAMALPSTLEEARNMDTTRLFHEIKCDVFGFDTPADLPLPPMHVTDIGRFSVTSMHSYLICQIYAQDLFDSGFKSNPMDRATGLRYRDAIIGRGSSVDEMDMMRAFLGRNPKPDAFYEAMGLKSV